MKVKYVKFSDERRKEFCIKTIIGTDDNELKVYKKAVFSEGLEHIANIVSNASLLEQYYDNRMCKASLSGDTAEFEYVTGESLEEKYIKACDKGDTDSIQKLLLLHKKLILGKDDNRTEFQISDKFGEIFGEYKSRDNEKALKCCNYDAISSNIIFVKDEPVYIDYEWVFNFPVPLDVVLYHCIQNHYEHHPEMEGVYPLKKALDYLGVVSDMETLERTYRCFYDYVISDGENEGFALMKAICLKNTQCIKDVLHEKIVLQCECDRLQGVIDAKNREMFDEKLKSDMVLTDVRNELDRVVKEAYITQKKLEEELYNIKRTMIWRLYSKVYGIFNRK